MFPWRCPMDSVRPSIPVTSCSKVCATSATRSCFIRLRPTDAAKVIKRKGQENFNYGDYFCLHEGCSHLGCPTSLYEQRTNRILCPCHQSQFNALEYGKPILTGRLCSGPAAADGQRPGLPGRRGRFHRTCRTGLLGASIMSNRLAVQASEMDARYMAPGIRRQINKVFPSHWSFMLGEVALYSFVILLISGVYLTLFFDPSMSHVIYDGAYTPLNGVTMTRAYETTLDISFEVRGGLFVRQVHHWAALLFAASIIIHMACIFFTGAFRRPREANWVIGCVLLLLAMFEGFFGYSPPTTCCRARRPRRHVRHRAGYSAGGHVDPLGAVRRPVPGDIIIPACTCCTSCCSRHHPGADRCASGAGLVPEAHPVPGPGRTETNVVGVRILPVFAAKGGAMFAIVTGVLAIMAGVFQINPVWTIGPYNPAHVSAGSQPDIYMMWTDGLARLMPAWELYLGRTRSRRSSGWSP